LTASLLNHPEALKCPLFLFHADDDGNIPTEDVAAFAEAVKRTNANVTFARVPTGNHYDSMIEQGIPQAIRWLQSLPSIRK
jgi:dipeptidyl aminopeptidase/acylaminoacyl peptidase